MKNTKHRGLSTVNLSVNHSFYKYSIYIILLVIAALYIPVFKNALTNWDDEGYILKNHYLRSLSFENIKNIFTVFFEGNYHPLTLLSLAIDFQISGLHPWAYQLTNLLLHLFNILFVYLVIKKLLEYNNQEWHFFRYIPIITAILFGIHTFQVESVAWVSERKNVLYAFFFLASLYMYLKYLEKSSFKYLLFSIFLFILSILSKGTAVTLTLCILIIDYFMGRNLIAKKVIIEKIPYLLLSGIFGFIAIIAQRSTPALWSDAYFYWTERIVIAGYGFIQYLLKLCYPFNLSAYYPYAASPGQLLPIGYYISLIVSGIIFVFIWKYFRRNKMILFGVLFFIANICIVIQLLPVGDAVMADRYVYIPSIGFFFIVGYYISYVIQKYPNYRKIVFSMFVLYCIVLGLNTFNRVSVWKNSLTLWNDALSKYPAHNLRGYNNRASYLYKIENYSEAQDNYTKVLQLDPKNSEAYIGIGLIKQKQKDVMGALHNFDTAVNYRPSYEGYVNRAAARMILKDFVNAMDDLDKAYQMDASRVDVYTNRGFVYLETGKYDEALKNFSKAIDIESDNYSAYLGIGRTKQSLNDTQGALNSLNRALQLKQACEAYICRADIKLTMGDMVGAGADLDNAKLLEPDKPDIYINKGMLELKLGHITEAFIEYNKAVELDRKNYQAYLYRAIAKMSIKKFPEAVADLDTSIFLIPNAITYYYRAIAQIHLGKKQAGCDDLHQSALLGYTGAQVEILKNCR
jgi:protein O-mannosyl-transferase